MCKLSERAMLLRVKVTKWSATKKDRAAAGELADRKAAARDRVKVSKTLIDSPELDRIREIETACRQTVYKHTSPWADDGYRLLPVAHFDEVTGQIAQYQGQFNAAVDRFVGEYSRHVDTARHELGDLFSDSDYPAVDQVRAAFSMEPAIQPVPAAGHFAAQIADEEAEAVKAQIEARNQAQLDATRRDVVSRLCARVSRVAESLPKYNPDAKDRKERGIFHETLVTGLLEELAVLPGLNITQDPEIDRMIAETRAKLGGMDYETLKASETARKQATEAAQGILQSMAVYMGTQPEIGAQDATEAA